MRGLSLLLAALLLTGCSAAPQASSSAPAASSAPADEAVSSVVEPEPQPVPEPEPAPGPLAGMIVCLDPGHGITDAHAQEPVSPLSDETKAAYVSGASGEQITEEALNLQVALGLRDKLLALDAQVILTR